VVNSPGVDANKVMLQNNWCMDAAKAGLLDANDLQAINVSVVIPKNVR
jgi:hypothetical protein